MHILNRKIELKDAKNKTIILSETDKNFIILDDNTYKNKINIELLKTKIETYGYNVKIFSIVELMKKVKYFLKSKKINLNNFSIVTVGQGGKQAYIALNEKAKEEIEIKWSREWNGENSNQFATNIEKFDLKSKNIIIFEDVIATGETLFNVTSEIKKRGGDVKGIICAIINGNSPLINKNFAKTIAAVKINSKDTNDLFWYPAIYSTRHLFYGDQEMPRFYELLNDKYFRDNKIEKEIKKMRSE